MYPRSFDYLAPKTLEEALEALSANSDAKVLAGGHSLLPLMKLRLFSPPLLVDIGRIPGLGEIREEDGHVTLGAMVTHTQAAAHSALGRHASALAEAASWVGDPQVRNRGTVCGSLAHADPSADEPACVLALGATMLAASPEGNREISAEEFFVDTMTTTLSDNEILTELRLPTPGPGEGSAYDKLGRRGGHSDFAVAGAAAWVRIEAGKVVEARLALTGVSSVPALAERVSETLVGTDGSLEAVQAAAQRAPEGVPILEDLWGSEDYKAHLSEVFARRALLLAIERAGSA